MSEKVLIELDKAGAEWFIVGYMAGDERMIDVHKTGRSPHVETGKLLTGASEELILQEHKLLGAITDPVILEEMRREHLPEFYSENLLFRPRIFTIRQCAKKSNHGLNYIMGARRFSEETEMEERDCKKIIDLYTKKAYPNIPLWWESVKRELKNNNRTLFNCFGRKRRFMEAWGDELFKQAVAFLPQSTNVDAVNGGMIATYNDEWLMSFMDLLAQTHDSLTLQSDIRDWKKVARGCVKIAEYMSPEMEYGGRKFKLATELKMGLSWGSMREVKISNDIDRFASDLRRTYEGLKEGKKAA
jgi:hypothetical protein